MTCWCDKIKKGVNTVVAESRVTLDTGLLGKNIIVLTFEVARYFAKTVTKTIVRTRIEIKAV
jgi:hypothetical protein